jgi:hypothetical protein
MENHAAKNRSANIAFVLTPDLLRRLDTILREVSEQLEFTAKFADGVTVDYANVEQIIERPNSEHRSIVGLIAGTTGEGTSSANVVLKSKFVSGEPPIEYTLTGPQKSVIYLADQLDDWVMATRQWYSRHSRPHLHFRWCLARSFFRCISGVAFRTTQRNLLPLCRCLSQLLLYRRLQKFRRWCESRA